MLGALEKLVSHEAQPAHIATFSALLSNNSSVDQETGKSVYGRLKEINENVHLVDAGVADDDIVAVITLFDSFVLALYSAIPECTTLSIMHMMLQSQIISRRVVAGSLAGCNLEKRKGTPLACFTKFSGDIQSRTDLDQIVRSLFSFLPATFVSQEQETLVTCLVKPDLASVVWEWLDNLLCKIMTIAQ